MRDIYKIDYDKLRYPRECYSSAYAYRIGLVSPSRLRQATTGGYGTEVLGRTLTAEMENRRLCVNQRCITRRDWKILYRHERKNAAFRRIGQAIAEGNQARLESGGGAIGEAIKKIAQKLLDEARPEQTDNQIETGGETDGTQED